MGTAGVGLYNYAKNINAPLSLKELGMPHDSIASAAKSAVQNAYWNPRSFDQVQIQRIIENAYHGRSPEALD